MFKFLKKLFSVECKHKVVKIVKHHFIATDDRLIPNTNQLKGIEICEGICAKCSSDININLYPAGINDYTKGYWVEREQREPGFNSHYQTTSMIDIDRLVSDKYINPDKELKKKLNYFHIAIYGKRKYKT